MRNPRSLFSVPRLLASGVFLLSLASTAHAATFYWAGSGHSSNSDQWENSQNWSTLQKGSGGSGVPGATDKAVFSFSGNTVRIKSAVTVGGIEIKSNWTGSVLQGTGTIVVKSGSGGFRMGSGRFIGGNAAITVPSYTQTGGIVTGIQNTFTNTGALSITKGSSSPYSTFTATGTIVMAGKAAQAFTIGANVTKTLGGLTINNSAGGSSDSVTINVNGGLTLTKTLTVTLGDMDLTTNSMSLTASGLTMANAAQATMEAGDVTLSGNITVQPSATFTQSSGTMTLSGTNQTLSGALTFYNFTKTVSSADTLTFWANATQTITNMLTLQGNGTSARLALRSSTSGTPWYINPQQMTSHPSSITVSALDVKDSTNTSHVDIQCVTNCTDSGNNHYWILQTVTPATDTSSTTSTAATSGGGGGGGSARHGFTVPSTNAKAQPSTVEKKSPSPAVMSTKPVVSKSTAQSAKLIQTFAAARKSARLAKKR